MKFGNTSVSRGERCILAVVIGLLLCRVLETVLGRDWMSLLLTLCLIYLCICGIYEAPTGELTAEGVYVRHFFIRRFYRWEELGQVGVMSRDGRQKYYEIVLLKPNASACRPEDIGGLLRNQFRRVYMPYDETQLQFIRDAYGPLDFDQRFL